MPWPLTGAAIAAKTLHVLLCVLAYFFCGCCQHSCTDAAAEATVNDGKYLDLVHEPSPVSFAQKSPDKCFGLKILKLVHVLTCSSQAIEIVNLVICLGVW